MVGLFTEDQEGREPRVGPGTTPILRTSGFVQSKTCKENVFSGRKQVISKKKSSSPKLKRFFGPNPGDLQKKKCSMFLFCEAHWAL